MTDAAKAMLAGNLTKVDKSLDPLLSYAKGFTISEGTIKADENKSADVLANLFQRVYEMTVNIFCRMAEVTLFGDMAPASDQVFRRMREKGLTACTSVWKEMERECAALRASAGGNPPEETTERIISAYIPAFTDFRERALQFLGEKG